MPFDAMGCAGGPAEGLQCGEGQTWLLIPVLHLQLVQ